MSRRIRPSARKKTLHNVMHSALSETDKKCIEEVFEKFDHRVEVVRCKDCKHRDSAGLCQAEGQKLTIVTDDHFCGKGERKVV